MCAVANSRLRRYTVKLEDDSRTFEADRSITFSRAPRVGRKEQSGEVTEVDKSGISDLFFTLQVAVS